ncbi:MAG TPA: YfiR family protein [Acidobacteriaceae bacterium]
MPAVLLLCVGLTGEGARGQWNTTSQADVQAVYLYNFAKFVRWPNGKTDASFDICVAGPKLYLDVLGKVVADQRIDGRPIAVRAVVNPEDENGCDILFLDASLGGRGDVLLTATAGKPILTVSDSDGFLRRGGMVQFLLIENHVRFSVNLVPVEKNGIELSSELLKVAVNVQGRPRRGAP